MILPFLYGFEGNQVENRVFISTDKILMAEWTLPPGTHYEPAGFHLHGDECYYIIEGNAVAFNPEIGETYKLFSKFILNSAIIASSSTLISIVLGSLAAYSISRFETGGKNLFFIVLSLRIIPAIAIIIPLFIIFRKLHMINTYMGMFSAYLTFNLPISILILKSYFDSIPTYLEESAMTDGST